MKYRVPFIKPHFPAAKNIATDYNKILEANWFTNFGPFEQRFSRAIAAYIGDEYFAATFSSATSGLMASILGLIGRGDGTRYVAMPSFTFAAVADAVIWCGYRPVFVDIEPYGLHMDISAAKTLFNNQKYGGKIASILFCNAFGVGTTNIEDWEAFTRKMDVPLIIDSAAGFGSLYSNDRKLGSAGRCEIFSFHATKPFAIGEGGAVVSKDKELINKLVAIQNFGFEQRNAVQLGFNGKLQEFNAAIGLRQFNSFEDVLSSRKRVFKRYLTELAPDKFVLQQNAETASLCFATVIVKDAGTRDQHLTMLKDAGIDAKTYYSPSLHRQDYFRDYDIHSGLPVTELVDSSVLSLPIHDNMLEEDIRLVIQTLNG